MIAKYYKETFHKDAEFMPDLIPTPIKIPFTTNDIKSAYRKLMNNKSPGKDEISAKLIKSAPDILYEPLRSTTT